jgi:hypothetical protein
LSGERASSSAAHAFAEQVERAWILGREGGLDEIVA